MRELKIGVSVTNRESPAIEKYLAEISREELITADEEVELARRIRQKDPLALDRLVRANLRFVVSVAKQYQNNSGMQLNDLINEGNLGLVKAAYKFDETRGFKFISYAVWWIRQSIIQSLAEHSRQIRLPLNKVSNVSKINQTIHDFTMKHEREPTDFEIAEAMGAKPELIEFVRTASLRTISFDSPIDSTKSESAAVGEMIADENIDAPDHSMVARDSLKKDIAVVLQKLSIKEREVLQMHYGIGYEKPYGLDEIADLLKLTRERVRQIKERAVRRLGADKKIRRNLKKYNGE